MEFESEHEREYRFGRNRIKHLYNQYVEGKISYYDYMDALDCNYEILDSRELEEVEKWKAENLKIHKEESLKKQAIKLKKEKDRQDLVNYILLFIVAIFGVFIFIWTQTKGKK